MFERRIGLDPVGFNEHGNIRIAGPSEIPQWAPGHSPEPWRNNETGSIPLSLDKNYVASSEAPGRNAPYAIDDNARTWWAPTVDDLEPWLQIDLTAGWRQDYVIDSTRLLFLLPEGDVEDESAPSNLGDPWRIRRYRIEVSSNGKTFSTVVDKTGNGTDNAVEFDAFAEVPSRYVRLTLTGWPPDLRAVCWRSRSSAGPCPSNRLAPRWRRDHDSRYRQISSRGGRRTWSPRRSWPSRPPRGASSSSASGAWATSLRTAPSGIRLEVSFYAPTGSSTGRTITTGSTSSTSAPS